MVEWEKSKLELDKVRQVYVDHSRRLDELEDELDFVRGRDALLRSTTAATTDESDREQTQGARSVPSAEGAVVLPPRPFEIDEKESPPSAAAARGGAFSIGFNRHAKTDDDQGSDDGTLPPIDNGREEEGFIDRSGATGGSVVAALGRALTVKRDRTSAAKPPRNRDVSSSSSQTTEGAPLPSSSTPSWQVEKFMEDRNVKAALDFSKTK